MNLNRVSDIAKSCLGIALSALCLNAEGAVITFDDRATFLGSTAAVALSPLPVTPTAASLSADGITFTATAGGSTLNNALDFSTLIPGAPDLAFNGVESMDVTSVQPLTAFGFDFHEPSESTPPGPSFPDTCNSICVDSTFTVTLFDGVSNVGAFSFNRPDDSLEFVGFISTLPFDRIQMVETVGTADNEFFGNFLYTRTVPTPATTLLLGAGLLGLALRRRRVSPA